MNTQSPRLWIVGGGLLCVIVTIIGWFLIVSPQLSSASSLRDQRAVQDDSNTILASKISAVKKLDINELRKELATARQALPSDSGLPEFTRQLAAEAAASAVTVTSIAPGQPTIVGGTASAATSGTPGATGVLPSGAGKTFAIPVTIVATGSTQRVLTLLQQIQQNGSRRALVTSVSLAPASTGTAKASTLAGGATLNVQMQVFVAPKTPAAEAELEKLANGG
jgi:hypothetical protein